MGTQLQLLGRNGRSAPFKAIRQWQLPHELEDILATGRIKNRDDHPIAPKCFAAWQKP
jgi:hypothetical protein